MQIKHYVVDLACCKAVAGCEDLGLAERIAQVFRLPNQNLTVMTASAYASLTETQKGERLSACPRCDEHESHCNCDGQIDKSLGIGDALMDAEWKLPAPTRFHDSLADDTGPALQRAHAAACAHGKGFECVECWRDPAAPAAAEYLHAIEHRDPPGSYRDATGELVLPVRA